MKVVVFTLGCKVNQYESRSIINSLMTCGHTALESLEPADAYILNTCAITGEAERKSRQAVARMNALNKNAPVFITGCASHNNPEAFKDKHNVVFISGTPYKGKVAEAVTGYFNGEVKTCEAEKEPPSVYEDDLTPAFTKTRSYIKIQDGCNSFCSYCIVPYLRGRSRSRSIESIVEEAVKAAEHTGEIVITGINLSAYGRDNSSSLTELVRALKYIPVRKRLGSLECGVITEEFIESVLDSGFCNHFHLSMQSGSTSVLNRMNRKYTAEEFIDKVKLIRSFDANCGIMCDIITGFPGETENEHEETIETMNKVRFGGAHIFPYSEREGTAAAKFKQVEKSLRKQRAKELTELQKSHTSEFHNKNLNRDAEVYVEENEGTYNTGYTENYIKVYTTAPVKTLTKVKLKQIYKQGVIGENG